MNTQKRRFGFYSIRVQILVAVVAIVVLAVVITQAVSFFSSRQGLNEGIEADLNSFAETAGHDTQEGLITQINLLQVLSDNETIRQAVTQQNLTYSGAEDSEIAAFLADRSDAWEAFNADLISATRQNAATPVITRFLQQFPSHTEIIITDRLGATVYTSGNIDEYVHNGDEWWQAAWRGGRGARYIGNRIEIGESAEDRGLLMAVPIESNGEVIGTIRSLYRLDAIQSDISTFDFGDTGRTLLVDANNEIVVAADDTVIGTVLDLPTIGEIETVTDERGKESVAVVVPVADGQFAEVENLGWTLVVFQDADEVYAPVNNALNAGLIATVIMLFVITGLALYFAQRLTRPLDELTASAQRLATDRDYSVRVQTHDDRSEIGVLGQTFNVMAEQVQTFISGLESRVAERVKDLEATLEVGRLATSIRDAEELLPRLADTIRDRFSLYYTQIYLLDDAQRYAILRAGTGEVGRRLLNQNHRIDLEDTSIVGRAVQTQRPVLVSDTEESTLHLPNPMLPDTRSELAIPLAVGGQLFGVLDMQAAKAETFNEDNVAVFETMANQIAGVLQTTSAFAEANLAIQRADQLNQRLIRENWEGYLGRVATGGRVGYQYDLESPTPIDSKTSFTENLEDDGNAKAVVPIKLGAQQIGNILVSDTGQKDWTPDELQLIEDVASRVAQSIEQLRAFDETETRARELAIVAEVSAQATSTLNPTELLQSVVELTKRSFNLYHVHIYLLDDTQSNLVLAAGAGDVGKMMVGAGHRIPLSQEHSLVARSARLGAGVVSNNVMAEPDFLPNPLLPNTRSEMAIPMKARGELLGVLDVQADRINRFDDEDVQVKTTLAGQLAVALANARLFEQTQNALEQAETLYTASQALALSEDFADILQTFIASIIAPDQVAGVLTSVRGDVQTQHDYMKLLAVHEHAQIDLPGVGAGLPVKHVTLGQDEQTEIIFIEDLAKADVPEAIKERLQERQCQALVSIPLVTSARWLGNIVVFWPEKHTFSEREEQYFRLITPQVASIIDSIVLLEDSRARALEMQVVAEVSSLASALTSEDELLRNFANLTREKFNRYHAQIYLLDEDSQRLYLASASGQIGEQMLAAGHYIPIGREHSLVARAARTKEGVISNDVTREPDFLPNPMLPKTRSEIAIPMMIGSRVLGVLDIQDNLPDQFGDLNIRAQQTLANQIAVTLQNARQFQRSEELQKQFQSVLDNASSAMISIDVEQNITIFNQMAERVFGYSAEEMIGQPLNVLIPDRFASGHTQHIDNFRTEEGVTARAMADRYLELYGRRKNGEEFPIEVSISKLQADDATYFTAVLNDITERKKSEEDLRKRAIELQVVADVSAATNNILDQQELLTTVATLTRDRFELYHAHIYLLDEQNDLLVLAAGAGRVGEIMLAQSHAIPVRREHSLVARAARTKEGVIVNRVLDEPDFLPNPLLPETRAEMAVPIMLGEQLLGVLDVQSTEVGRFTDEDVRIKTTLSDQIAVALQNARLFSETQQRLRETEATNLIGEIFRSGAAFDHMIEGILEAIQSATDADTVGFSRFEEDEQKWYGVAGVGGGLTSAYMQTLIDPAEAYPHGVAAIQSNDVVVVENAKTYPNFPQEYTDEDTLALKSVLALPLASSQRSIGVIFINYTTAYRKFEDADIRSARNFALQVATGLERLQAAEEVNRLASMIGQSEDFMAVADFNTQDIVYINEGGRELLGYDSLEELQDKNIAFFHTENAYHRVIRQGIPEVFDSGSWRGENELRHKDGYAIPVDQTLFFIRDAEGNPQGIATIMTDIRERVAEDRIRQVLFETANRFNEATTDQEIFDALKPAVDYFNPDSATMLYVIENDPGEATGLEVVSTWQNPDIAQPTNMAVTQFSIEDYPASGLFLEDPNKLWMFDDVERADALDEQTRQLLAQVGRQAIVLLPLVSQGRWAGLISFSWSQPQAFSEVETRIFEGVIQQITPAFEVVRATEATKVAQQEAERRAAELQVVAEVSTAIATILDPDELLDNISNLTRDSFGLYHAHVYLIDEDQDALILSAGAGNAGRAMVASGHRISMRQEHSLVARAARLRQGVITNDVTKEPDFLPNPLLPETKSEMSIPIVVGEQLLGILDTQASTRDYFREEDVRIMSTLARQVGIALLNARLYQEQLETAERLREVDQLKSEFLASMSHELRTPLNSIIGYAEVILDGLDGPLNEELEEDVNAIHGSGKLLLNLINDILDLAKIEAGQMELEYAEIDLKDFMTRTLENSRIFVKDKPVELKMSLDDNAPALIEADPIRLQQIVNNLISNAAKFTEEGSITLDTTAGNGSIRIAVIDTGIGIPQEKLNVIFERFRQADQSSTRRAGGTGLGLDITRRLVRMHGGEITVSSKVGEGSVFSFTIPVERPNEETELA